MTECDMISVSNTNMKKDALYCRVSTDQQAEFGESIETQQSRLLEFAKQSGYNPQLYVDAGFSAKDTNRPELKRLLKDIEVGLIRSVNVTKLDRITRSLQDLLSLLKTFLDYGVTFKSITQPFDTSTATGKLQLQLIGIIAEWERSITSERVSEDMRHMARSGKWLGGPVSFGYTTYRAKSKELDKKRIKDAQTIAKQLCPEERKLYQDPEEASVVKKAFDLYIENQSIRAVTHKLNEKGFKTREGGLWSLTSLRRLLSNQVYIGKFVYNRRVGDKKGKARKRAVTEWITAEGLHQPIISEAKFVKVQAILTKQSTQPVRKNSEYLLSGFLFCGKCKGRMHGYSAKNGQGKVFSYYKCINHSQKGSTACQGNSVRRDQLEQAILKAIFEMKESKGLIDAKKALKAYSKRVGSKREDHLNEHERLEKRKTEIQRKKQTLIERLEDGTISSGDYKLRTKVLDDESLGLDQKIFQLESTLAETQIQDADFDSVLQIVNDIQGNWQHMTILEQKMALSNIVKQIVYTNHDKITLYCYSSKLAPATARVSMRVFYGSQKGMQLHVGADQKLYVQDFRTAP